MSLSYYPLVYLPTVAALRRLDSGRRGRRRRPRHRRAGRRSSAWCCPRSARPCSAARCWSGCTCSAEYGALQLLNYPTLTTGDPRPVPHRLQRPGGHAARAGPGRVLPAAARPRAARCAGSRRRSRVGSGVAPHGDAAPRSAGAAPPWRRRRWSGSRCWPSACRCVSLVRWLVRGHVHVAARTATSSARSAPPSASRSPAACWRPSPRCPSPGWRCGTAALLATLVERSVYPANALPGIVVALALVTVSIRRGAVRSTRPCRCWCSATRSCSCRVRWSASRSTLELAPPVLEDVARLARLHRAGGGPPGDAAAGAARARRPAWPWSRSRSAPS